MTQHSSVPRQTQLDVFQRQMKRAIEFNKPLIVHSRDADEETTRLMSETLPKDHKIHVHCFSGSKATAATLMEMFPNLCFGFTGSITFKNAQKNRDTLTTIPLDRILLETDGPFMAPGTKYLSMFQVVLFMSYHDFVQSVLLHLHFCVVQIIKQFIDTFDIDGVVALYTLIFVEKMKMIQ
jgi:Tat protein secretion system quality control protein TatD with DNase activity